MKTKIPRHLGIILDGNRRWAKDRGLPALAGHQKGAEKVKDLIDWCLKRGIKILTLFVFSSENWQRPKHEVDFLMRLLSKALNQKFIQDMKQKAVKIRIIGQREKLPLFLRKKIEEVEGLTKNNKAMTLNFALSYGGRAEITQALQNIIKKKIAPEKVTEDVISRNLWTSDVDLLIRTGKEQRISNFLIWQSAYSELYFSPQYWPDFAEKDLAQALAEYDQRQRRFGK